MAKSQILLVLSAFLCLTWGFQHNTQYTYKYNGRSAAGIYSLKQQNAVIELQSQVVLQVIDENTMIAKLTENRLKRNGNFLDNPYFTGEYDQSGVEVNPGHPEEIEGQEDQLPQPEQLSAPFVITFNKGVFSSVKIGAEEPLWIVNLKKSIVGQLQLDITGIRRDGPANNLDAIAQQQLNTAFTVFEDSVTGDCSTKITINQLTPTQIHGLEAFQLGAFQAYCQDKPVYEVVKTKDYNRCQNTPVWYSAIPATHGCSFGNAACEQFMQRTSVSKCIGCGESISKMTVIHASGFSDLLAKPFGYETDELVNSVIINWALQKKEQISSRFSSPSSPKEYKTLSYVFDDFQQYDQDGTPAQPGLTQAYLKSPVPVSTLQQNIFELLRSVAKDLKEKPDSEQDNMERLNTVGRVWPMFSLDELRSFWQQVKSEESLIQTLFVDTLVQSGSNPSVMFIKELIESQQITGARAMFALAAVGYHAKTPTQELLHELVALVKSSAVQQSKALKQTAFLTVADLFNAACASPYHSQKRFSTELFGQFCDQKSSVMLQEFLPFLMQEVQSSQSSTDRIIALTAVGSLGVEEIIPALLPYLRGTPGQFDDTAERVRAILSLHRVAQLVPEKVHPVLATLAGNVGERAEIRKAALSLLFISRAPQSLFQRFAASTWFEPSAQMASYTYSLIKSLSEMPASNPEMIELAKKASIAFEMAKPQPFGYVYSFHDIRSSFLDEDVTAKMATVNYQVPEEFFPVYLSNKYYYQLGPLAAYPLTVSVWNYNMYEVWSNIFGKLYNRPTESESSGKARDNIFNLQKIWESLNVTPRADDKRAGLIQVNLMGSINYFLNLEKLDETIPHLMAQAMKFRSTPYEINLTKYRLLAEYSVRLPTELGLPMRFLATVPMLVSMQGNLKADGQGGIKSDVSAEIGWKISSELRVELPFVDKYIATGVEVRVELRAPKELNFNYQNGQLKVTWTPGSKVSDLFYYHVKPYTISRSLSDSGKPALEDESHVFLVTANQGKVIRRNLALGERYGVNMHFLAESELEHNDMFSWMEWFKKWDVNGISNLGFIPFDLRHREYALRYDPSSTRARSVQAFFEHQYVTKTCQHTVVFQSGSSQPTTPSSPEIISRNPIAVEFRPVLEHLFKDIESGNAQLLRAGFAAEQKDGTFVHFNATLGLSKNAWYTKDFTDFKIEKYTTSGPYQSGSAANKKVDYAVCYQAIRNWNNPPQYGFSKDVLYLTEDDYVGFGEQCDQSKLRIKYKVYRDDYAARAALNSQVGQQCARDLNGGFKYGSPACTEARRFDQTYNNYEMTAEADNLPQPVYDWLNYARRWINNKLYPFTVKHVSQEGANAPNRASLIVKRDPFTGESNMTFVRPMETLVAQNVRFSEQYVPFSPLTYTYSKVFYPLSAGSNFIRDAANLTTGGASESKCYVGSKAVYTFDGVQYNYTVNQCHHVLLTDCSKKTQLVVLARQGAEGQKIVSVVYHKDILELDPNGFVTINGNKQSFKSLDKESRFELRSDDNKWIRAVIYPSATNGVVLEIRSLNFFVKVQGAHVQLSAPRYLRGSACGMCGDYNQEKHAEFKTADRCAVSSGDVMAASFKLSSGEGCSAINADVTRRLKKETQTCEKVDQHYQSYLPEFDLKAPTKCTRYEKLTYQGAYVQGQCQSAEFHAVCQPGCKAYSMVTMPFSFKCQGEIADFTAPMTVPSSCITA